MKNLKGPLVTLPNNVWFDVPRVIKHTCDHCKCKETLLFREKNKRLQMKIEPK